MANARQEQDKLDAVAKVVYDFSRAVIVGAGQGVVHGVGGVVNMIAHPINAIQDMGNLAVKIGSAYYDAAVITAGHLNAIDIGTTFPGPGIDSDAINFLRHAVRSNPQLYIDANNRMNGHIEKLKQIGQHFSNAPWNEQVRMATMALTSFGTNMVASGAVINSIKAVSNLHKYGVPYNPPSFHYWMERGDALRSVTRYDLADLRALKGDAPCLYAVMQDNRLIITPQFVIEKKMVPWEGGQMVERISRREIKHSEVTRYQPVLAAGEAKFVDGRLISLNRDSGRYLAHGPQIPHVVERGFYDFGITESIGKFVESQGGRASQLAIRVPNKMGLVPPGTVQGGIVLNVIAEGLRAQQEQREKAQQQAHERLVQEQKRHEAANWHALQATQRQIIASTQCFNLPYHSSFSLRHEMYHLLWRETEISSAIFAFRLRYGSCPSWIENRIRMEVNSAAMFSSSLNLNNYYSYSGLSGLLPSLYITNLVNSWNLYNELQIYGSLWLMNLRPGGVAAQSGLVPKMLNSKAQALANDYYVCFPAAQFTLKDGGLISDELVKQVLWELKKGFDQKTLPFYSLHFNQKSFLYPVMHPVWEVSPLISKVLSRLDYLLKCMANGAMYDEDFLKIWHIQENCDEAYLKRNMKDLKTYYEKNVPKLQYASLREELESLGIHEEDKGSSAYKQPFETALRIIGRLKSIEVCDNVVIPRCDFDVETDIKMNPDYEQYVENYRKEHGQFPPEYQKLEQCYRSFAEKLQKTMRQLPVCQDLFAFLDLITAFCYLYPTLDKMGKQFVIVPPTKVEQDVFPKAFPPIPMRYHRRYDLKLTIKDMLSALRTTPESTNSLDNALATLFATDKKMVFPEPVKKQIEAVVKNKIIAALSPSVAPQEMTELNTTDITNTVNKTISAILTIAKKQRQEMNALMEEFVWLTEAQKKPLRELSLPEKNTQLKTVLNEHLKLITERWEKDQTLARDEILAGVPDYAHEIIKQRIKGEEDALEVEIKKYPHLTAQQISEARKKTIYSTCVNLVTTLHKKWEEKILKHQDKVDHFSNVFLENEKLAAYAVSETYTHTFTSFRNDLAEKNGETFRMVGGCGMSLPEMQSKPIPHADIFIQAIASSFTNQQQSKSIFRHNGETYVAYRLPVASVKHELEAVSDKEASHQVSLALLRSVHERMVSPSDLTPSACKAPLDDNGTNILHGAAVTLQPEMFAAIINQPGIDLETKDHFGNLPIHHAVEAGNINNVAKLLIKKPDLLNKPNHRGETPLMLAAQRGYLDIVKLLHSKGADFNACLPNGLYPLYMAMLKNFTDTAMYMVNYVVGLNVNFTLDSNMTALHLAIQAEETELAAKLIEKGAHCDIQRKGDGYTALHCAAKHGNVQLLTAMLAKYPNLVDKSLESGKTLLHLATEGGHLDAVRLLIAKGAKVDSLTLSHETPLMLAIYAGREEVAKYLASISKVDEVNCHKQRASLLAVQYAMPAVADILIERNDDIEVPDQYGFTAFYYLVRNGEYNRVRQLIEQNRPKNLTQDFAGQSLLAVAAQNGHFPLVRLLEKSVAYKSNTAFTLLDYAVMANEVGYVLDHLSSVKNVKNLALLAMRSEAKECLEVLFAKRKNEIKTYMGELLRAGITVNSTKMVGFLLEHSVDVKQALDSDGNTALHMAVKFGAHRVLSLLATSGAQFSRRNKLNQTAFHLAILQKDHDFLRRLFKQSKSEEWPLDIWNMEERHLTKEIIHQLEKYKKILDKNEKVISDKKNVQITMPLKQEEAKAKSSSPPPCPVLNEAAHKLIKKLEKSLRFADYANAITLLTSYPFLIEVMKTERGGPLLEALFENINELDEISTVSPAKTEYVSAQEQIPPVKKLLLLLAKNRIDPGLFIGEHNVLLAMLRSKTDKLACYRFDLLHEFFSKCLNVLASDKSYTGMCPTQLALYRGKDSFFDKLDAHCAQEAFHRLHEAVIAGKYKRLKHLLKRYPVDALNAERQTPLMFAVSIGNIPMINLLLKHGASVDQCDLYGRHALHYAMDKSSSLEAALCILPLLKNPNQADRFGVTPFMEAAAKGRVSIMRFLFKTKHDIHAVDNIGQNALHHAARDNQKECIAFLVAHKFAVDQPEAPTSERKMARSWNSTPLQIAARRANESAVFELLKWQADPEKQDRFGYSLCEYGIMSKNKNMQDLIKFFPGYHDPKRNNSLLRAAVREDQVTIVSELILSQADMNAVLNEAGQTALHIAAIFDAGETADIILQGNVALEVLDHEGFSPLHYAAQKGSVRLTTLLCDSGADPNQKTKEGETPLTLACLEGQEGAVAILLQAGADVHLPNQYGKTPAQIALEKGQLGILQLLQDVGDKSLKEQEQKRVKSALPKRNPLMMFHAQPFVMNQNSSVANLPLPKKN